MNNKEIKILLNRAASYIGAIAEIQIKSKLFKYKLKAGNFSEKELIGSIGQMKSDLAKYSRKVEKIYKELRKYGLFTNME